MRVSRYCHCDSFNVSDDCCTLGFGVSPIKPWATLGSNASFLRGFGVNPIKPWATLGSNTSLQLHHSTDYLDCHEDDHRVQTGSGIFVGRTISNCSPENHRGRAISNCSPENPMEGKGRTISNCSPENLQGRDLQVQITSAEDFYYWGRQGAQHQGFLLMMGLGLTMHHYHPHTNTPPHLRATIDDARGSAYTLHELGPTNGFRMHTHHTHIHMRTQNPSQFS